MSGGAEAIAAERQRQIDQEGYMPEHDAQHPTVGFIRAAQCYIRVVEHRIRGVELSRDAAATLVSDNGIWSQRLWPWDLESFKPTDQRRDLVKAGALIAAAIDRLDAAEAAS